MATEPPAPSNGPAAPSQRAYRAACPNCGAPVDFRSPASAFAVCGFCKSTIVRDGDALRRIGESAELFDDHTPLQIGASGKILGAAFTLVGRLQYRYAEGTWNEWHAFFDNGRSGWLSEDNGRYVLTFDVPLTQAAPQRGMLHTGMQQVVEGQPYWVASVTEASLIAAQGELPSKPVEGTFTVADLRSDRGEVGTLDYGDVDRPTWSVGRAVALSELAMTGLADSAEKTLSARGIECPNCGTALEVKLSTTQSIVCHQCHAVVDLNAEAQQNIGGALAHYAQDNGSEPLLPLGTTGTFAFGTQAAVPWQVVGYVERREVPEDADDEQSLWREYLLFNRPEGFAFLVDAEDGWSWTVPITGVPKGGGAGAKGGEGGNVQLDGISYKKLYSYTGEITYVLGEFYWHLSRNQRTYNTDFVGTGKNDSKRLNREQTGQGKAQEIVWSKGEAMTVDQVVKAFNLPQARKAVLQRDATPISSNSSSLLAKIFVGVFIALVVLMMFRCSSSDSCGEVRQTFGEASTEYRSCMSSSSSRTSGGSYGGFSSGGGGHK